MIDRPFSLVALALVVLVSLPSPAAAQEPTLFDMLKRTTTYVDELLTQLTGTVSEERYEQRTRTPGVRGGSVLERTLLSDFLIVTPEGAKRHYGFRDVFEVDGKLVRDRKERLISLFLSPTITSERQIEGILRESARYNLGEVDRTINHPTLALLYLSSGYKSRFEFERETDDTSPSLRMDESDLPPDTWVIAYEEVFPITVIRGGRSGRVPSTGRFWIEQATGRVLITELVLQSQQWDSIIVARYGPNEAMGHFVPVEMREGYDRRRSTARIDGSATYSRFRRFRVLVDESQPFRD